MDNFQIRLNKRKNERKMPVALIGAIASGAVFSVALISIFSTQQFEKSPSELEMDKKKALVDSANGTLLAQLWGQSVPSKAIDVQILRPKIEFEMFSTDIRDGKWVQVPGWTGSFEVSAHILNNSDVPIQGISGTVEYVSHNRKSPYNESEFDIDIEFGIDPGESKQILLSDDTIKAGVDGLPDDGIWKVSILVLRSKDGLFATTQHAVEIPFERPKRRN